VVSLSGVFHSLAAKLLRAAFGLLSEREGPPIAPYRKL
jgi:hypothetical protein